MVKNRDEAGGSASSSKKKKLCTINDDTLKRLKEAVTMLDRAAASVQWLLQLATTLGVHGFSEPPQQVGKILNWETTSFLTERQVFGREVEKDKIIGWLKQPTQSKLSSFGIIGIGGQGKTTLAQFAYQEMGGSTHFDKRIWVWVSVNFSVEGVTRKILSGLGESESFLDGKPLNALQRCLKKRILSKKILLILDDIWDDKNRMHWEQLIAPLRFVKEGSKILFTTRMKSVVDLLASVISTEHEYLSIEGLGDQQLRLLFNSYAFYGVNPDDHRDLQKIGDQILKMFRGSPLAAKVIGNLLSSCMDRQYWSRILNHNSILNLELAKDVMEVLKLSYYHLPADLQVCFRFCSIFPQGYEFRKDELIKMWMAVGFIQWQRCLDKRPEDLGEDYFNYLLRKSFFEYTKWRGGETCVMHDLMHELAQNVSNGECCRVEHNDKLVTIPSSVRHISVHVSEIGRVSHLENLHSLIITDSRTMDINADSDPFVLPKNSKYLRLLKISSNYNSELSKEINAFIHLRYLSIRSNQSLKILPPASIHKLYHLQVLELFGIYCKSSYLGIEPTRMSNLVRLRYMSLPIDIPGVHKLTSLQELDYNVGHESGHRINELGTLNDLRELSIYNIENVGDPAEAKSADLLGEETLISLSLNWGYDSNPNNPELIIDELQPNPNLMNLTIRFYKGQRSPKWMEDSPPLNLSRLELLSCPEWKDQLFSCQMPYLKFLHIDGFPKLDRLPDLPLSLIKFEVSNVGLTSLPYLYNSSSNNIAAPLLLNSSLKVVEMRECPNLISLDGFLQQENVDLQVIEQLTIRNCDKLKYLPIQGFVNLTSLKHLSMEECPKLVVVDFEGNLLPENLQKLELRNCGEVDVSFLKTLSILSTLTDLSITCENISALTVPRNLFRSLKNMHINECAKLAELLFVDQAEGTNQEGNFDVLKINYRSEYSSRYNIAVNALPEYNTSSDSSGGPSAPLLKSSLSEVIIRKCPSLTSLNGFLQQEYIEFHFIKYIYIHHCINLVQLPQGAFGNLVSLTELILKDCPMLVAVDNQRNLLPTTLESLTIGNCGEVDAQLLESTAHLPALIRLQIINCANITHIPYSENAFGSLSWLSIRECDKLTELSSREQAHGVNLQGGGMVSLKISDLEIGTLSLLHIEPLRSLRFVSTLHIRNYLEMDAFPEQWFLQNNITLQSLIINDARSLKSLPATMSNLSALKRLNINRVDLLEELPELPASLHFLRIEGARSLKSLPATMTSLTALEELVISHIDLLEELPELPPSLRTLIIEDARSLKTLPPTMASLTALANLQIRGAVLLEKLPKLPASLVYLSICNSEGKELFK